MVRSFDGGKTSSVRRGRARRSTATGMSDPARAASRSTASPARATGRSRPSPSRTGRRPANDATDEIVLAWPQRPDAVGHAPGPNEQVHVLYVEERRRHVDSGGVASPPTDQSGLPGDRDRAGRPDVYVTYMSFQQPWQSTTASPRMFDGVVRHADVTGERSAAWSDLHRAVAGDARGIERQRADRRVPRRLQLRVRDGRVRRRRLERRPQCGRLWADRRLPAETRRRDRRRRTRTTRPGRRRTTTARRRSATPTSAAARTPTRRRRVSCRREGGRRSRPPVKSVA